MGGGGRAQTGRHWVWRDGAMARGHRRRFPGKERSWGVEGKDRETISASQTVLVE